MRQQTLRASRITGSGGDLKEKLRTQWSIKDTGPVVCGELIIRHTHAHFLPQNAPGSWRGLRPGRERGRLRNAPVRSHEERPILRGGASFWGGEFAGASVLLAFGPPKDFLVSVSGGYNKRL